MIAPKEYALSGWLEAKARAWHEEMDEGKSVGSAHANGRVQYVQERLWKSGIDDTMLGAEIVERFNSAVFRAHGIKSAPNP